MGRGREWGVGRTKRSAARESPSDKGRMYGEHQKSNVTSVLRGKMPRPKEKIGEVSVLKMRERQSSSEEAVPLGHDSLVIESRIVEMSIGETEEVIM